MSIRDLKQGDLPLLLELYRHLHPVDDPLPEAARLDSIWQEIQANPRLRCVGLFVEGTLVSSCQLAVIPNLTRGARPYGLIENVVTHADHRRRGHGRAVLAHALELAFMAGCYKVMLLTGRQDEATLGFYEACGFDRRSKQGFVARPPRAR
jgi:GNAT superfamily N-acetyltransferase